MATGPRYSVKYRRRRNGKTNYGRRLALLKSKKHRLVIRRSNKYIACQIVEYDEKGDKTLAHASSRALKKLGWKHSCLNLPAAYLTGLMISKEAKKLKIEEVVPDTGLYTLTKGNRIYAALKGAIDGGLKINVDPAVLPSPERLAGEHISKDLSKDFETIKKKLK